jgi:hypothetical protein
MAVTMKNAIFWDVTPCGVLRSLVTDSIVPSSPILVTMMIEAVHFSEMSILTTATWCNIPEGGLLHVLNFIMVPCNHILLVQSS